MMMMRIVVSISGLPDMPKICLKIYINYNATSSTRLTSRTCEPARSSRTGIRSRSSLSWASENQLLMGTACCGWNIYEVGELSIIIVSLRSRPTWERSQPQNQYHQFSDTAAFRGVTNLDIIPLVVITAFPKQPMVYHFMYVQLVEKRISILVGECQNRYIRDPHSQSSYLGNRSCKYHNLVKLANTLHELIHSRSFNDINIVILALDLYGYGEIGLMKDLERVGT